MNQSDPVRQAQAYIEAVSRGDWDAAVQFLSPKVLLVDYSYGVTHRGRDAWVARLSRSLTRSPTRGWNWRQR